MEWCLPGNIACGMNDPTVRGLPRSEPYNLIMSICSLGVGDIEIIYRKLTEWEFGDLISALKGCVVLHLQFRFFFFSN